MPIDGLQKILIADETRILCGRSPVLDLAGLRIDQPVIPEFDLVHVESSSAQVDRQGYGRKIGVIEITLMRLIDEQSYGPAGVIGVAGFFFNDTATTENAARL